MAEHGFHLTTFEPLAGLIMTADRRTDGWHLTIRHQHHCGRFSDCEPEHYEALSTNELADVLSAVVSSLGAVPGPGDWNSPSG